MIQAHKDANTSKESNAEEQVTLSTAQHARTVPVEQRRTAVVTNTLAAPATLILPENKTSDGGNYQYHRLATLGGQLQHVVTSLQLPGPSTTALSDSLLTLTPRCTVSTPQEVARILVATTTNSLQSGVGLQNSVVNINTSVHQQLQTLGNISSAGQRTKHEICGTVFTQPTTATTVAQRIVLNSGMSDVVALRIAQTSLSPGLAPQQIMVLDTCPGLVPSSDVTKVHSYSLASASVTSLSSAGSIQKMVVSPGQALQNPCIPHKVLSAASGSHTSVRTPVKRPLSSNSRAEMTPVNSVIEVVSCLSNVNKLLSGLMPPDSKATSSIPNSPKPKKIKLEKHPVASKEVLMKRKKIADNMLDKYRLLKIKYYMQQIEYFFLKNGGNMMDNLSWKKKCPSTLFEYLRANPIEKWDSDTKLVMDVLLHGPMLLSSGISSSTQGFDHSKHSSNANSSHSQTSASRNSAASLSSQKLSNASTTASTVVTKSVKQPMVSHKLISKHNSLSSVYDSQIGSQEEIAERAKQEAYVTHRIANLRKSGLWSLKRLPKVQECPRNKALWDYLLEEMGWLATDFAQERKWKKAAAKKCSRMIIKYFQEKEAKAEKAEKEEQMKLRKIAGTMAKEIKTFWNNIEKLVEYKQQTWLEEKRKKALDVHLNFIVDQTEKYSSWLTQGLNRSCKEEVTSSRSSSPVHQSGLSTPPDSQHSKSYDADFEPQESGSDDEETIEKAEKLVNKHEQNEEIEKLKKESEIPIENLLESLPAEYLNSSVKLEKSTDSPLATEIKEEIVSDDEAEATHVNVMDEDDDFHASEDEEDEEHTIEEQEELEAGMNHEEEIKELEAENEMSVEALREKYAGAFSSDFQMEVSEEDSSSDESESMSANENGSIHSGDENSEVDVTSTPKVESPRLTGSATELKSPKKKSKDENPSKEISDIAATAESFQPKGNTLSTTQVYTKVPFLLKHQLREYQHIGLDWLNAMYDKKLNGILADEMGLGKTIQTISILAHLACEKGIWGPHLIVVPTSVMLNWEMELKKWCPAFKILTYYGTPKERKQKRMGWTKPNTFHVCITSYKLVVQDHVSFRRKRWKYLILDEAQHIKNFKSQRWQLLLNFQSTHRLLLTGTPLQNNLMELWSLMHFLMPNVFQSHREFREWFVNPVTGMIEGSHEYNESLIKRLHKVLRPFLLRRLKCEVEKQLPKKYEHVIMCRLSKRQRYLYDDFMSQTKTKETLATGNFMSVINILMQLRKVCNHPNMFEERPTVSPFLMEGITFHTASLVCDVLGYDPFKHISLMTLNLLLADLELSLTAFAAHRVMKFKTPPHLIMDMDNLPEPPPPCPFWKTKINFFNSQGSGRNSPIAAQVRNAVPPQSPRVPQQPPSAQRMSAVTAMQYPQQRLMVIPGQQATTTTNSTSPMTAVTAHSVIGQTASGDYTVQLLPQTGTGVPVAQLAPIGSTNLGNLSTQLTLQIQPTAQGAVRLSMPINISRLFQAAGSHIVLAPSIANSVSDSQQLPVSVSSTITFPSTQNSMSSAQPMVLSTSIATATVLPQVQKAGTPTIVPPFTFNRPQHSLVVSSPMTTTYNKPIGRVAPLNLNVQTSTTTTNAPIQNHTPSVKSPVVHSLSKSNRIDPSVANAASARKNSLYYLESLARRQEMAKKNSRRCLAKVNSQRCAACPIYGKDLVEAVTFVGSVKHSTKNSIWSGKGYVNCLNAPSVRQQHKSYWHYTDSLCDIVATPEKCINQLKEIINRFVFAIPAVTSAPVQLHVSHPNPSWISNERRRTKELSVDLLPRCALLHPIFRNMKTQFPELRLIQYDCGKLQRLALLMWELKTDHHRVLIFTQMTRMLDILEQFLNYHGHTYLRLDGNTKVEQRQALMERFNADKRIFCFILSTRSGGIGVNLTGADTVIFYDSDWNPTMDAQAQDRCHRIGQTRDVHIYRLISVRTVEENILKKANQKRILGNLAIEGGNFTTAFFKTNTLHELFGLEAREDLSRLAAETKKKAEELAEAEAEKISETQLGQALGMAEEESDLQAAKTAQAEAVAEFAEFDESIPLDDNRETEEKSAVEEELDKLIEQLTPVERYAMLFLESLQEPVSLEQLKLAEEEIEAQKKDWELGHLKALKEEEERRSGLLSDEDPMLCYSRSDAYNQMYFSINGQEAMPLWAPPTPPQNENDIYIDYSMGFMYEQSLMHESRLPPIFIKKEAKRMKVDPVVSVSTNRKQKVRKDDMISIPRSLFDRPSAAILKMRREAKLQKVKGLMVGASSISKPVGSFAALKQPPIVVSKPAVDAHQDKPEWLVHEDWSILQVVQDLQSLPLSLTVLLPAHVPNWDLAADATNITSRVYRSSRLCRNRYESVIVPREEGKILYDTNPKKQKKTKGIYKTKNNRPMKTSQLYSQDNNGSFTNLFVARLKHICDFIQKRKPVEKPTSKHLKHSAPTGENGVSFEEPLTPMQIASNRAERISREKLKNQPVIVSHNVVQASNQVAVQAAQVTEQQLSAAQRHAHQQATVTVSGTANLTQHQAQAVIASLAQAQQLQAAQLNKANIQQGTVSSVSLAKSLSSGIMVNASPNSNAGAFATISKALGQAGVAAVSAQSSVQNAAIAALTSGNLRNQRATVTAVGTTTTMTVQEMVAAAAAAGQVRGLATTVTSNTSAVPAVVSVAGLTAVHLQAASQRIPVTAISAGTTVASVSQLSAQATTQRNITQLSQLQAIRQTQTAILRQREQQTLKQQQQLKRLQTVQQQQVAQQATKVAVGSGAQLTIAAAQQRVAQQQAAMKSVGRAMSDAEMAQLLKRQQQLQQQKQAQLTTAQILAQAQQQVQQQQVSITCGTATLVKTVSAPSLSGSPSVAIPVSAVAMGGVNINVSLPQGKAGANQGKGTTTTITNQQLRQIQFQQQILNQARKGGKVANLTQIAKVSGKATGISASALSASPLNAVQIVQHSGQAGTTQQVKSLQAAMTVQQIQQAMKQVIPQNLPVVVTATPSMPGIQQQQQALRGEPGVVASTIKPQTTTLPSTTLTTTSGVLKGSPAVVVGQQQTAAILQQVAASSAGLTPQQAMTLAVRAAASQAQAQGQQQVQIQVQQSPHGSLVSPQSQVVVSQQSRIQQISTSQPTISITQPVQQQSSSQSGGPIVSPMSADSTLQSSTHVVMHSIPATNSSAALSIATGLTSSTASSNIQVVQAAMQVARQQVAQQQASQQKQLPFTMRLRNPPK